MVAYYEACAIEGLKVEVPYLILGIDIKIRDQILPKYLLTLSPIETFGMIAPPHYYLG